MDIERRGAIEEAALAAVRATVCEQATLEDVGSWGLAQLPARMIVDVIAQDEYTHDVVIPYAGDVHLVYDTT